MPNKDYYDSLGVAREASADDIQRAYRKLARKFHPDVNQTAGAEDRFKEISEAYEVLKDPEKRKMYDRFGPGFASGGPPPGGPGGPPPGFENIRFEFGGDGGEGFGSFFESFFGGGGAGAGAGVPFGDTGRGRPPSRGRDHEARIVLTLEEAAAGGSREVTLTDPMTGRSRTHKVKMPVGVRPGQKIRLAGGGGEDAGGGKAGDLYLTVELKPHDRLRLEGKDLYATVPVTPWEAALGGKVKVPTLDGQVTVKVPAGASTGRKIRLRGKGFPNQRKGHGDLYAEIKIVVPSELTERERALFEELARVSKFRPR